MMNQLDVVNSKIDEAIAEIEKDDRRTPIATVFENAPLALVQVALENQLRTLKWVKSILEKERMA